MHSCDLSNIFKESDLIRELPGQPQFAHSIQFLYLVFLCIQYQTVRIHRNNDDVRFSKTMNHQRKIKLHLVCLWQQQNKWMIFFKDCHLNLV